MRYMQVLVVILCIAVPLVMIACDIWKASLKAMTNKCDKFPATNYLEVPLVHEQRFLDTRATRWVSDKSFHRYLTSPDVTCDKSFRAGKKGDGGWDVCLTEPFTLKPPCLVYSFGINYDFSFDDAVAKNFNCTVNSFDPSMSRAKNHKRGNHVYFFKDGIGGKDFKNNLGWDLYSLATIFKTHNHSNKTIDYLKMDVERSEWAAIPDMAVKGTLKQIKQIGIEIHRTKGDTKSVHLISILEDHGFRKWKMHYNIHCRYKMPDGTKTSVCLELYYINTRFIESRWRNKFMPENI